MVFVALFDIFKKISKFITIFYIRLLGRIYGDKIMISSPKKYTESISKICFLGVDKMEAKCVAVNGKPVVDYTKTIMIKSSLDVDKLPTSTKKGTFDTSNDPEPLYSYQDANDYCGVGSIAYTEDLSFVVQLGLDDKWHEV